MFKALLAVISTINSRVYNADHDPGRQRAKNNSIPVYFTAFLLHYVNLFVP